MRAPNAATLALALASGSLLADSVTLTPDADTSIMEGDDNPANVLDDYNQGADHDIPVGTFGTMNEEFDARGLMRFNIAGSVPGGAFITGGRLRATVSKTPSSGPQSSTFAFRRVKLAWVEGSGAGDNPGGRTAEDGETTWNNRLHPSTPWTTPGLGGGTDFEEVISASQAVVGNGTYVFELTAAGIAAVQSMLDSPSENHGWMFKSESEGIGKTARRWFTREAPGQLNPAHRGPAPELELEYDPPPPLPEFGFVGSNGENFTVHFTAMAGFEYEVQIAQALKAESWTMHTVFNPAEDGEIEVSIPLSENSCRFVRVIVRR